MSDFYVDVKAFKVWELPPATWNITTGFVGSMTSGPTQTTEFGHTFSGIDGGDIVLARFGGLDGTNNSEDFYIYSARLLPA